MAVILQSGTALLLDKTQTGTRRVVFVLLACVIAQLVLALRWIGQLADRSADDGIIYDVIPLDDGTDAEPAGLDRIESPPHEARPRYLVAFGTCIAFAWLTFFATLWNR